LCPTTSQPRSPQLEDIREKLGITDISVTINTGGGGGDLRTI